LTAVSILGAPGSDGPDAWLSWPVGSGGGGGTITTGLVGFERTCGDACATIGPLRALYGTFTRSFVSLEGLTATATSSPRPLPPRKTIFDAYISLRPLSRTAPPFSTRVLRTQPAAHATCLISGLPTYARPPPLALVSAAGAPAAQGRTPSAAAPAAHAIERRLWLNCKSGPLFIGLRG
jgi:hypothetical protein